MGRRSVHSSGILRRRPELEVRALAELLLREGGPDAVSVVLRRELVDVRDFVDRAPPSSAWEREPVTSR